jgi:endonuclease-3 related protein
VTFSLTNPLLPKVENPRPEQEKLAQSRKTRFVLMDLYGAMSQALGPMKWWPARTPFEVIVGAILTQNTAWKNVEQAIENLRRGRLLCFAAIEKAPLSRLAELIRPSGYFRQKARKLKAFVQFLR